ncbi:acyl-CoA dehydrogenase family protein [Actinomadura parmotrematis]|uniref:Acyl-CoA dehydrogenase family protein n=1 Tax=Actinomadura parmotrematis TaxID=2864039 RepID=A0ABS7G126_9ACTN|nr:acyl-CoA dehydrogenase family protein [Actinomadura parmotrematis]MBW8486377.1 acyl-CoA dehydrogenase family protein [Actinomadura parmotrematis]
MNVGLGAEAAEYGRQALRALEAAGGDRLVQDAERDPAAARDEVARVLGGLGAWDLRPRGDADDLEAAAALCRSAGYWAVPYPVAERLARPADLGSDGLIVVAGPAPRGAVAGLDLRWTAVTLDGRRGAATARDPGAPPRTTAFVTGLDVRPLDEAGAGDVALGLVLPCWTLLGMLDRAIDLTRAHVLVRRQFGGPLADQQGVRFQLTDAEVERRGVEVLAEYALWSVQAGLPEAVEDALALRLAAIEAAGTVFRTAHLLHGAIGFCDESPLSWLSRYGQPLRRLPLDLSATRDVLARRIDRTGLTGLFEGAGL